MQPAEGYTALLGLQQGSLGRSGFGRLPVVTGPAIAVRAGSATAPTHMGSLCYF